MLSLLSKLLLPIYACGAVLGQITTEEKTLTWGYYFISFAATQYHPYPVKSSTAYLLIAPFSLTLWWYIMVYTLYTDLISKIFLSADNWNKNVVDLKFWVIVSRSVYFKSRSGFLKIVRQIKSFVRVVEIIVFKWIRITIRNIRLKLKL